MRFGNLPKFETVLGPDHSSIMAEAPSGLLRCDYHYHPEMEITYVVSGSGRALFGTQWVSFTAGDIALIRGNVPHLYVFIPPTGKRGNETRVIKFKENIFSAGLLQMPEFLAVRRFLEECPTAMIFDNNRALLNNFNQVLKLSGAEQLLQFCALLICLEKRPNQLIMKAHLDSPDTNRWQNGSGNEQMEKALHYLQKHFTGKITLADTAKAISMDKESFRRFFCRNARMNFSGYLLQLRLVMAKTLLRESSRSITEIAAASGFRNLSNFNRLFLTHCKMSPREYRKQ